jgi:hypothetical protein
VERHFPRPSANAGQACSDIEVIPFLPSGYAEHDVHAGTGDFSRKRRDSRSLSGNLAAISQHRLSETVETFTVRWLGVTGKPQSSENLMTFPVSGFPYQDHH